MFSPDQIEYAQMIAEYGGVKLESLVPDELMFLWTQTASPPWELVKKYGISETPSPRPLYERYSMMNHRIEGLFDLQPMYYSYGVFTPSYLQMLRGCVQKPGEAHTSLLVGALTTDTIREWRAGLSSLFNELNLTVIDIEGLEIKLIPANIAKWIYGDALRLGYQDQFDTIHTQALTSSLADPYTGNFAYEYDRIRFFEGAWEALKPQGRLVMTEMGPEDADWDEFAKELTETGFADIQVTPALAFDKRRSVFEFVKNPTSEIDTNLVVDRSNALYRPISNRAIRATKP